MPNTKVRLYNEAVLNSLFYKKTLLLESEYDRMFYEYYSELRLHEYITNVNFIGFNGMPDIKIVFDEMHNLGINVACIVDIDFLLSNKQVPDCIRTSDQALYQKHVKIAQMYSSRGDNEKTEFKTSLKRDGLKYLEAADQTLFSEYESVIADYSARGVFIVKVGELERWTKSSKDNMSEMLGKIEKTDFRDIKLFMKSALKVRS